MDNALHLLMSALLKSVMVRILCRCALTVVTSKLWRRVGAPPLA
ncbi:MAG: hypothetical protein P8Y92_08555 [Halioglobus sp.]